MSPMMNRSFTTREKVLLAVLAVLVIGCFYYLLVFRPSMDTIQASDTSLANVESDITIQQAVAANKTTLEQQIDAAKASGAKQKTMPAYDNAKNEISMLDGVLSEAVSYSLDFSDPEFADDVVRRAVSISFTANSYADAQAVLTKLIDCPYRCLISDFSISGTDLTQSATDRVSVTVNVVFFESLSGSTTASTATASTGTASASTATASSSTGSAATNAGAAS